MAHLTHSLTLSRLFVFAYGCPRFNEGWSLPVVLPTLSLASRMANRRDPQIYVIDEWKNIRYVYIRHVIGHSDYNNTIT